nr:uncharacterized protein K02A2.6-like [Aegilops tauschii subsp. strangulata]
MAIAVNGEVGNFFHNKRGLRQGHPVSPLLFNFLADALGAMLDKARIAGHIRGVVGNLIPGGVSHLQYADDTLLLFEPDLHSIATIKAILLCFELMSGLKINFHKCEVVSIGMDAAESVRVANLLNCKLGKLPFTYLGLPIAEKTCSIADWEPLNTKVAGRGLSLAQVYDKRIHLLPGTVPVAVHLYRYPQLQKDELEQQCTLMLALGIIQISMSPFSALVLLVRNSDDTWRVCIDYRILDAMTLKDKFPIPVVDELLDELHGARFFTKLDLRSGYHQVWMHPDDVAKTVFRTHHDHLEVLVMPFGLSNAPATFQALMNDVLRPYLHRFVLVFFDDILIYSTSWAEHLLARHHRLQRASSAPSSS